MNDTIQIKSGALGTKTAMSTLLEDELGYCTDKEELYIGTSSKNKRLCGVKDIERITALEEKVSSLEGQISTIMARLEALESPEE